MSSNPVWQNLLGELFGKSANSRAKSSARRKRRNTVGGGENAWRRQYSLEALERRELLSAVPTTISISSSQEQAVYGQGIVLTAAVSAQPMPPAGGTVVFRDGATVLGSASLNDSGIASLGDVRLPVGAHDFSATYVGDSSYASSEIAAKLISTVAGGIGDGGPATAATLSNATGIAVDAAGNQYIADSANNLIRKVDKATGLISTVAGNGIAGYSGDGGAATSANLNSPRAVAIDSSGNLFFADNHVIRMVDKSTGVITTVAGNGAYGYSGDGGSATAANLNYPQGIAVDSLGNLFIADSSNNRIRKVDKSTGVITTVAGNGGYGYSGDGVAATSAQLSNPRGVAFDASDNLFIADYSNHRIRMVDHATGKISTFAGTGSYGYSGDGAAATAASLYYPQGIAFDSSGNLFIADSSNSRIRMVTPGGTISTVAGSASNGFRGDGGPANAASLYYPQGVAVDVSGNLFIADNGRIRKVDNSSNTISTVAGGASYFAGEITATAAVLSSPQAIAADAAGNLFIADAGSSVIRKLDRTTGLISTFAGTGIAGYSGDGDLATEAQLAGPSGVAIDSSGNLFIADRNNNRIRMVDNATGKISTVAGNGVAGYSGDSGLATAARLNYPQGIALDSSGNLFIADSSNYRIRMVDHTTHLISTVAGNGYSGYSGDGRSATAAQLSYAYGLAVDSSGNLFIGDSYRIRMVDNATGKISTVAGNGNNGYNGDGGLATAASIYSPRAIAFDSSGNLFIADTYSNRIRMVDHTTHLISTVSGNGDASYSGDGVLASAASLNGPQGIAFDAFGNLFIADTGNRRIREVPLGAQVAITPAPLTIIPDNQSKVYGAAMPALTVSYVGLANGDTATSVAPTLSTMATAGSHVSGNPYYITASGAADSNYTITYAAGFLTVTPAPLTITADDQTKAYGAELPELTARYAGFIPGDTADSLSTKPALTTNAKAGSHVATNAYTITASGATSPDYTISYIPGSLTVTPVPLTITAENKTKVYGAALPELTASYTGLTNGDAADSLTIPPLVSATATVGSHVSGGPYPIVASRAFDADYVITYVPGALTITPAPLTVTADNKIKVYGDALPAFTATTTGLVNGDRQADILRKLDFTTDATPTSPVSGSPYVIYASAEASPDYTIVSREGELTVEKATPHIVSVDPVHITYGTPLADSQLHGTATFVVDGQAVAVAGTFTFTSAAGTLLDAGDGQTVAVTFTPDDTNYAAASGTVTVNVGQATPDISPDAVNVTYGTALDDAQLGGTATFVVDGQAVAVAGTFTFTSAAGTLLDAGDGQTVAVTFTPDDTNYAAASGTVVVNVALAAPTVKVINAGGTYSGAAFAATATVAGVAGTPAASLEGKSPTLAYYAGNSATGTPSTAAPSLAGTYTVVAAFAGSNNYKPASVQTTFSIAKAPTVITLGDLPTGAVSGQTVTLTATVAATNGAPAPSDGTVIFFDGTAPLGSPVSVTGGVATLDVILPAGNYNITAAYSGSANYEDPHSGEPAILDVIPAATPNERYVHAVYHDVLGRDVEPAGLEFWARLLDAGLPIGSVAQAIAHSDEYYANSVITPVYQALLNRLPEIEGLLFWTEAMHAGLTRQQLEAQLAASDEFYLHAGGDSAKWIAAVYQQLLNRAPEVEGADFWLGQLAQGQSRFQVTTNMAGSAENNARIINDDYFRYLGREAEPAGLAFWLAQFSEGKTNEDLIAGFTGSDEYYHKHAGV